MSLSPTTRTLTSIDWKGKQMNTTNATYNNPQIIQALMTRWERVGDKIQKMRDSTSFAKDESPMRGVSDFSGVEEKLQSAREKLSEIRTAGENATEELIRGMGEALDDLEESVNRAAGHTKG
jgi:hypothetical protein